MSSGEGPVDGLIWVESGEIRVKDPRPGGKPATVFPCPKLEILVSGRKIAGEEPVVETTPIQVHFHDEQPTVSYAANISQGGLEASAVISMRHGIKYELTDVPPSETLVIQYVANSIPATPDPQALLEAVRNKGVVFGIDTAACEDACARRLDGAFIAARGQPYVPGKNGEIQFLVPMERIVDLPPDILQIDFRDTVRLPDVKAGQVIAIKTDPVPGVPGTSVTGAAIPPPRPRDPHFRAGKGVEIRQDRPGLSSAVATISGVPLFAEESGVISVDPVLTHKGDVDLSSGNLRSSGSLNILGQVTEGMKVECEGNQEIAGTVTGATLKAWGSIRARGNIFKSTVIAGKDSVWIRTIDTILKDVEEAIESVKAVETQIKDAMERETSGQLTEADALILDEESHIDRFRRLVVALAALYKENLMLFPKDIAEKVRATRDSLAGFGTGIFEKAHLIDEQLADARVYVAQELIKGKSDVVFPYAQSSTIESSRDIIVTGQGAFYCAMMAGRAIKVAGSPGLIRGGEARARELIQVNTAGGHGAAPTLLAVSRDGKIHAQTIFPNTVISVGPLSYRTESAVEAVKASIQGSRLLIATTSGPIEVQ